MQWNAAAQLRTCICILYGLQYVVWVQLRIQDLKAYRVDTLTFSEGCYNILKADCQVSGRVTSQDPGTRGVFYDIVMIEATTLPASRHFGYVILHFYVNMSS